MYSTLDLQKLVQMLEFLGFDPAVFPAHTVLLGAGRSAGPGGAGQLFVGNGASADPSFQTLAALNIATNGTVIVGSGATRPASPQLNELWVDTTLGPYGQLIYAAQISPSVIWANTAGFPV